MPASSSAITADSSCLPAHRFCRRLDKQRQRQGNAENKEEAMFGLTRIRVDLIHMAFLLF
jgi:hypothetical protein